MSKIRITIDVDPAWLAQAVTMDEKGEVTFHTDTAEIVGIEEV